jgi:hypothetical protein
MTQTLKELKDITKCLFPQLVKKETWHLHLSLKQNTKYLLMAQNSFSHKSPTLSSIPVRPATLQTLLSSTQNKYCVG